MSEQQSMKPTATGASCRRSSKKKTGCFVGVVNLDELNATNGACLPEPLRMVQDDTALMRHALPMPPVGHASRRGSYDEITMPPLGGGGGGSGASRSSSMPPNMMMGYVSNHLMQDQQQQDELYPYKVPSNFYAASASSTIPPPANRSASMVMMGSMPMYQDTPNQNGKRPSMTMSVPAVTSMTMSDIRPSANKKAKSGSSKKEDKPKKRWTWKKPKEMPKRPLSAYNLFFATERKRIVTEHEAAISYGVDMSPSPSFEDPSSVIVATPATANGKKRIHRRTHGKISFSDLARTIADRWKFLEDSARAPYAAEAAKDKARYDREMVIYNMKKDLEKKKAEQKRLEEIIAAAKTKEDETDETIEVEKDTSKGEEEEAPAVEASLEIETVQEQPPVTHPTQPTQALPSQGPHVNTNNFNPFPRTDSFGILSIGQLLDDDLGFGNDDLVASFNNSHNLDTTGDATALAQAAIAQASSAMQMEEVPIQRPPLPPFPQQQQQSQPTSTQRPPSRSLDMLLEGTSEDRNMLTVGNNSFSSSYSDRSTTKKANKTGASHIGEVSLPTPNVPLVHSAASNSSGGSGGEDTNGAYADAQLIQDIMASIDADERYGIGGGDGAPAIPSSLGGAGDLVGNFVRGSAA